MVSIELCLGKEKVLKINHLIVVLCLFALCLTTSRYSRAGKDDDRDWFLNVYYLLAPWCLHKAELV